MIDYQQLRRAARRWEWAAVAALCAVLLAQCVLSAPYKSPVADSMLHYRFGEMILGAPMADANETPWDGTMPVSALFVAASRLRGGPLSAILGASSDPYKFPITSVPSVLWMEVPVMLMGAATLLLLWWWIRRAAGSGPAICTAVLFAFEPNLIGNSRFATTDIPSTFGFLAGCAAIAEYFRAPKWWKACAMAGVLAAAQLTKLPNLILYPVLIGAFAVQLFRGQRSEALAIQLRAAAVFAICAACFVGALHIAYGGMSSERRTSYWMLEGEGSDALVHRYAPNWWGLRPIIPPAYSLTLARAREHNTLGHDAYLLGSHGTRGWWYYFPIALLVKTPLPILIAAGLGKFWLFRSRRFPALFYLLVPAAFYLLYFCFGVIVNIGIRHILPVFPALIALAGVGLWRLLESPRGLPRAIAGILVFWTAAETIWISPNQEQFFNEIAGGPYNGWKWLGDSNLEMGQDIAIAQAVGDRYREQGAQVSFDPETPVHGIVIMRAMRYVGISERDAAKFDWIRGYEPIERPSPALMVFRIP
ncbi:hypothetical protein BH09SUM1_BH09SUM1_14530 [soil metagenome]